LISFIFSFRHFTGEPQPLKKFFYTATLFRCRIRSHDQSGGDTAVPLSQGFKKRCRESIFELLLIRKKYFTLNSFRENFYLSVGKFPMSDNISLVFLLDK
jgi:hypothetical protein